jgi:hypothetical protein
VDRLRLVDGSGRSEARAGHVKVLELELLDPRLKHPVLLPQLNQFGVNSVNGKITT